MLLAIVATIVGIALTVVSADKFVDGASALADRLGMSHFLIGLTIVSIGTSGMVYPAAGFSQMARQLGLKTLELNLEASGAMFDAVIEGPATQVVPDWVSRVLSGKEI